MTNRRKRYTVDYRRTADQVAGIYTHVIVVGAHPVIDQRSNGQATYMTYRSEGSARRQLGRVLPDQPTAEVMALTRA